MPTTKEYGKWDSDISADAIGSNITFSDALVDPVKKVVYHIEDNPEDASSILVDTLNKKNVLPEGYNARDSVNDYGGAPAVVYDGIVYFSNQPGCTSYNNNGIYKLDLNASTPTPIPVTPNKDILRYANFSVNPKQPNLLVAIQEDHTNDQGDNPQDVIYRLSIVDTTAPDIANAVYTLREGAGFYSIPVFSPSGDKIVWQEWDLPYMPWESGTIYVGDIITSSTGQLSITNAVLVAGGDGKVSATFPSWVNDTTVLYISDKDPNNRYQNPFLFDTEKKVSTPVLKSPLPKDFSEPQWWLGYLPYAILGGGTYGAFTAFDNGTNILYVIDLGGSADPVQITNFDFAVAQHLHPLGDDTFVFTGTGTKSPVGVFQGTVSAPSSGKNTGTFTPLKTTSEHPEWEKYIATPVPRTLPVVGASPVGNYNIYVIYYLPTNPDFVAPAGEKPPCIINVHGGPTGLEPPALNWTKTYYTSRGYAWLDVNYRGSSGFGRDYIELLNGNWGYYDNEDSQKAHQLLVGEGLFDPKRVTIRGGSAGGYTTLSSVTFVPNPRYYQTACSIYGGVADPTYLTKVIEKFECQYIYTLFGSPPGPAWDSRNPIDNIKNPQTGFVNFSVPLLVLHGTADGVVPIEVAKRFLNTIRDYAPRVFLDHEFYCGEGHHFRKKANIIDALEREHQFYYNWLLPNV